MSVDLRTRYLGLELRSPLVAASSPATGEAESLKRLEGAGAAAAVLPSLFEEEIELRLAELARFLEVGAESFSEALDYRPVVHHALGGPEEYLRRIEEAKSAVSMPIIGSLNGMTPGGWVRYARRIESAGADALELNIGFVASRLETTAAEVEGRYLEIVGGVREAIGIPLAVKVGPFFTAFAAFARRVREAGAEGLVLFNRFVHPDLDLEGLSIRPNLVLSSPHELRLPMMWIALLRGRLDVSLAASTGVHGVEDVVKLLLVGADCVQVASSLLVHGPGHMAELAEGLPRWLSEHEYESVEQMKGSMSQEHCPNPEAFERINYMRTLASYAGVAG